MGKRDSVVVGSEDEECFDYEDIGEGKIDFREGRE